ncbi:MAG: HIT domain-containing protein [Chloroflexota bacterium]
MLRLPLLSRIIAWVLVHMSFALPLHYRRKTEALLAFEHPRPAYPYHVLLVPCQILRRLEDLDPQRDSAFLRDLFATVQSLVDEDGLSQTGYRLIVNGGPNQEFPQLHFHLISEKESASSS